MESPSGEPLDLDPHPLPSQVAQQPTLENSHPPISGHIISQEEQSLEGQQLLKITSQAARTRSDCLQPVSECPQGQEVKIVEYQLFQRDQQKGGNHEQRKIQCEEQNFQTVNQNILNSPPEPPHQIDPLINKHQIIKQKSKDKGSSFKKRLTSKNYFYNQQDNSSEPQAFKFPFMNNYLRNHSVQYLRTMEIFDKSKEELGKILNNTFINCDVRYFNWKLFCQEVGKFDVLIIDPPWRIKGAQQNDSQFMFSNCKFSLQYNTMANSQISRIPLHLVSDQGFIFLWILNSQLDSSIQIMQSWGYELVQEVIWVKLKDEKINMTHGYYFMHSYEVCLIGYKCKKNKQSEQRLKIRKSISWNTVFAQVRQKSQKPEDIYAIIDIMFKGGSKIEVFARNHNIRFGILSAGNELGQSYDKWLLKLQCDQCGHPLHSGQKRFKSKNTPNFDLCPHCIDTKDKSTFFQLANNIHQNIKHEYISCNHCGVQPIWGIRFQCITCHDFDICQNCFDRNLKEEHNFHPLGHQFMFLQIPVYGNGFHIHQSKCASCYQNPIIGIIFSCTTCKNLNLCQKCYFERSKTSYNSLMRRHKPQHQLQVIFESKVSETKKYECFSCKKQILEHCWMCQNCYNFFFCQECFSRREEFKSLYANTHKPYHVLTNIF